MSVDVRSIAQAVSSATAAPVLTVPGGGASLELLDAIAADGVDVITVHHEGVAAAMAATLGRLDGRPGVAVGIRGPGVANLLPGLALAALEGWPVLTISEAHPVDASTIHKRMDHGALTSGVAKMHLGCSDGASLTHAAALAAAERPGPVTLDLRASLPEEARELAAAATSGQEVADDSSLDALRSAIAAAQRPIVIAGAGARRAGLGTVLAGLRVPVASTAAAKGIVDEAGANSAGVITGAGGPRSPEGRLLAEADLVLRVGVHDHELLGALRAAGGATIDVPLSRTGALLGELTATSGMGDPEAAHAHATALRTALVEADAFLPAAVLDTLARTIPGEACLVVDTGDFCTIAEHVWQARDPDGFLGASASRSMGTGLAMALAAALARPARPVVLAVGDGGIGAAFGELTLAAERRLPLLVLNLSDGGYASIRGRAIQRGLRTDPLEVAPRGWARAAEALGIPAAELAGAGAAAELATLLADWDPSGGPLFLTCRFDPAAYLAMTEGLR